jgi:hypothetical protein
VHSWFSDDFTDIDRLGEYFLISFKSESLLLLFVTFLTLLKYLLLLYRLILFENIKGKSLLLL